MRFLRKITFFKNISDRKLSRFAKIATMVGPIIAIIGLIITLLQWLMPEPMKPFPISQKTTNFSDLISDPSQIPAREAGIVRIIVTQFDQEGLKNYKVTDLILANLRAELKSYQDIQILGVDRVITELEGSNVAIKIGELYDASIVIWGWYGLTETSVPVGIHFEVIRSSEIFAFDSCALSSTKVRKSTPGELSNLTLQTDLSNELSYATIFTLGLVRYEAEDWSEAVSYFNDAIKMLEPTASISAKTFGDNIIIDTSLLYYYRGLAYANLGKFPESITDIEKFMDTNSEDPDYLIFLGGLYRRNGQIDKALELYQMVINTSNETHNVVQALVNRGLLYQATDRMDEAVDDFNLALSMDEAVVIDTVSNLMDTSMENLQYLNKLIEANPNHVLAYYFRSYEQYKLGNYDLSDADLSKAIELYPNFLAAHAARAYLRINYIPGRISVIEDYQIAFQSEQYQTFCSLHNMGVAYYYKGEKELASKYFNRVISEANEKIIEEPENAEAYFVRGLSEEASNKKFNALKDFVKARYLDSNYASEVDDSINQLVEELFALPLLILGIFSVSLFFYFILRPYRKKRGKRKRV